MKQWKCSQQDNPLVDSVQRKKSLILHCTWVSYFRTVASGRKRTQLLNTKSSSVFQCGKIELLSIWQIQLYHWWWTYHWWWLEFIKILLYKLNVNNHLFQQIAKNKFHNVIKNPSSGLKMNFFHKILKHTLCIIVKHLTTELRS